MNYIIDHWQYYISIGLLNIDFARVFGTSVSFDIVEFLKIKAALLKKYNFLISDQHIAPSTHKLFCGAEGNNLQKLVIDSQGYIYKCWKYIFTRSSLNIEEIIKDKHPIQTLIQWSSQNWFSTKAQLPPSSPCFSCKWYFYCLGMCPDIRIKHPEIIKNRSCQKAVQDYIENLCHIVIDNKGG